ncbi:MAG: hypothetical protein ACOX12_05405 [Eggerthellaceae bacterium]|jgi:predicted  nucleic acid-binding Zn-ribbon protein
MPDFISETPDWDKVKTQAVADCLAGKPEGMTDLQALQQRANELKAEFDTLTDQGTAIYDQAAEIQRQAQEQADAILDEARRQCAEIQAAADARAQAARDRTPVALLEKLAIEMEIQNRTLGQ